MKSRENITHEQSKELLKRIDKEELRKVTEEAEKCRLTIESSILYDPVKVSDLTVTDFSRMIREIVRDEVGRFLPIHQIPKYEGFEIPRTPGELNDNSKFYTTDHTVFKPQEFDSY